MTASRNFWKPFLSATILLCLSIVLPGMRMPPLETMSLKANAMSSRAAEQQEPGFLAHGALHLPRTTCVSFV